MKIEYDIAVSALAKRLAPLIHDPAVDVAVLATAVLDDITIACVDEVAMREEGLREALTASMNYAAQVNGGLRAEVARLREANQALTLRLASTPSIATPSDDRSAP